MNTLVDCPDCRIPNPLCSLYASYRKHLFDLVASITAEIRLLRLFVFMASEGRLVLGKALLYRVEQPARYEKLDHASE